MSYRYEFEKAFNSTVLIYEKCSMARECIDIYNIHITTPRIVLKLCYICVLLKYVLSKCIIHVCVLFHTVLPCTAILQGVPEKRSLGIFRP